MQLRAVGTHERHLVDLRCNVDKVCCQLRDLGLPAAAVGHCQTASGVAQGRGELLVGVPGRDF